MEAEGDSTLQMRKAGANLSPGELLPHGGPQGTLVLKVLGGGGPLKNHVGEFPTSSF